MNLTFLGDLIGLSRNIEELAVSKEPLSIMYNDMEVVGVFRVAGSGTGELLAEKIDDLTVPPKYSRMIEETLGYILDLEDERRLIALKKTKEIKPYEGNYPEC